MGEFVAKIMLRGIIHPDMQLSNIGFKGQNFKFLDFADVYTIAISEDLSKSTVRQLTTALFPLMKSFMKDFTVMSYFRAGFIARGGVLGHTVFSNVINMDANNFRYVCVDAVSVTYDASFLYSDEGIAAAITE